MSWIDKILPSGINRSDGSKRATVPEGVWTKCIKCEAVLYKPDLERNANVCPKCEHHMRVSARQRLDLFLDPVGREEVFSDIEPIDRLRFRDKKKYVARLAAAQKSTGERDALVAMRGTLHGLPVVTVAFEFGFHGGSMGQAVGEKFSRAAQLALKERIPLVCFAASGGARMQEALISLMQMAKTSAVIERMHTHGVPYISVLTDPIYGGVSASLALLGDLNIAEPEARAGFAGPNIIEQTIRQQLPKGFQRSEFLLEHGAIDMIVARPELRDTIARLLAKMTGAPKIAAAMNEEPVVEDVTPAVPAADALAEKARADAEAEAATDGVVDEDASAQAEASVSNSASDGASDSAIDADSDAHEARESSETGTADQGSESAVNNDAADDSAEKAADSSDDAADDAPENATSSKAQAASDVNDASDGADDAYGQDADSADEADDGQAAAKAAQADDADATEDDQGGSNAEDTSDAADDSTDDAGKGKSSKKKRKKKD